MHPERFAQYWDDLDDWFWALALKLAKARRLIRFLGRTALAAIVVVAGYMTALMEPPLALAILVIMFMMLLYRAVTEPGAFSDRAS